MAVRSRAFDREGCLRRNQPLAPEHPAQRLDLLGRPAGSDAQTTGNFSLEGQKSGLGPLASLPFRTAR